MNIETIFNAILVNENIRSAMLIQPQDYNETYGMDKQTSTIVNEIKKIFPNLYISDTYETYQGTIISNKKSYNHQFISLDEMGKILGYPCYKGFEKINRDKSLFTMAIMVSYNNNINVQLMVNLCKDKRLLKKFNLIATNAYEVLTNKKYASILHGIKINKVYVDVETTIPIQFLINKLMTNNKISSDEMYEISNILANMDFSDNLCDYEFQYNNKIHKGILLDLLLKYKYNILSPFYPLQFYPTQQQKIKQITIKLENALIETLNKTKIKPKKSLKRI